MSRNALSNFTSGLRNNRHSGNGGRNWKRIPNHPRGDGVTVMSRWNPAKEYWRVGPVRFEMQCPQCRYHYWYVGDERDVEVCPVCGYCAPFGHFVVSKEGGN